MNKLSREKKSFVRKRVYSWEVHLTPHNSFSRVCNGHRELKFLEQGNQEFQILNMIKAKGFVKGFWAARAWAKKHSEKSRDNYPWFYYENRVKLED